MNFHRSVSPMLAIAGLLLAIPSVAAAADPAPDIDRLFANWKSGTPGCAVGIGRKGQPDMVRAYGDADLEHGIGIDANTVIEAGSSSKQFTAAAVLRLAERGQVALTDDVRKYLPELPDYGHAITIDHMLNHTSGLRDWGGVQIIAGWPRTTRIYTMDDVLRITVRQKSLNFVPGTRYSYTNTGYNLLALIVERVSGKSLADYSRAEFFEPLGMTHTGWRDEFRRIVKNRAIAYVPSTEGYIQRMPFENAYGNGGLLTTAGDLLRWNAALSEGRLGAFVTKGLETRAMLRSGQEVNYARGLIVGEYRGYREVAHPGATAGYTAWLGRYPQAGLSIALLCNAADIDATGLAHGIANLFLPPIPSSVASSARPSVRQVAPEGLFVEEATGMPLMLKSEAGKLMLAGQGELKPVSETEYRAEGTVLRFDGRGGFTLRDEFGAISHYRSVAGSAPSGTELARFAGDYTSDEAEAAYSVTLREGQLTMALRGRPDEAFPLTPAYRDAFTIADTLVRFRRDGQGAISGLSVGNERVWDLRFARNPAHR
ncbi:serine hydrolase domain-containing protein [Sphingomonas colocasiae]|uniref:Serine hydrolase n=1 Tax=Sphingomonas colocasiae TaxID=1848973 RepID=A0ABS7PQC0_9SPHN|nr:serine hydrolase domain-containing protein [Sphingomonas colocasiae]MBY8822915.1 serine hydrolase [Sphingomonas colocasiae]